MFCVEHQRTLTTYPEVLLLLPERVVLNGRRG